MSFRVSVRVMPRASLLDPQGQAVEQALAALGFAAVSGVHIGRAIELEIDASSAAAAEALTREMCGKLLANPVTEDYEITVDARVRETA